MLEVLKLLWDVIALRDASRKGLLDWRIWPMAFGAVAIFYGVGMSAGLIDQKHPEYQAWCIAAGVLDVLFLICFVTWAYRWQLRRAAARRAGAAGDARDDRG